MSEFETSPTKQPLDTLVLLVAAALVFMAVGISAWFAIPAFLLTYGIAAYRMRKLNQLLDKVRATAHVMTSRAYEHEGTVAQLENQIDTMKRAEAERMNQEEDPIRFELVVAEVEQPRFVLLEEPDPEPDTAQTEMTWLYSDVSRIEDQVGDRYAVTLKKIASGCS